MDGECMTACMDNSTLLFQSFSDIPEGCFLKSFHYDYIYCTASKKSANIDDLSDIIPAFSSDNKKNTLFNKSAKLIFVDNEKCANSSDTKFEKDYASVSSGNLIDYSVTNTDIGSTFSNNNDSHLVAPSDSLNDDIVSSSSSKPQFSQSDQHLTLLDRQIPSAKVFPIKSCKFGYKAQELIRSGKLTSSGKREVTSALIVAMKRHKRYGYITKIKFFVLKKI